ncbi:AraC family transcriptional regulator [Paenibacillus thailandensis]|uniref:AraC family transcriptional regulator n=1 Tax=Paenibacillus thailandensis TaxID=393250 RepID=A0ABW5QYN2_9BACL
MALFHYNPDGPSRDNPAMYLHYWGKEDCVPGHAVGPLIRDHYKVHFVHKGIGRVRAGDSIYELTAGQGFFIYPHVVTYYEADRDEPWTYSWIGFQGDEVERALSRTSLTAERPVFPMDVRLMPALYERMSEIESDERSAGLYLQALLYEFLAVLTTVAPLHDTGRSHPRKQDVYVHQSLEFIHTHYGEDLSVSQLARTLGLDRKYLSAIFKASVGVPPQQYLLRYRMDKACELLAEGKYTVGEVARSVGYRDALLFSRMFRKAKGVPPKEYRPLEAAGRH